MEKHKAVYGESFVTPEFRVSFPSVFEPRADLQNESFYSVTMLFDKKTDLTSLKAACKKIADQLGWKEGSYAIPLTDGTEKYEDNPESYASYKDCIVSKAKSKIRPEVIDRFKNNIGGADEFYGGCYARASITPKSYIMAGKKGITFQLKNLQKLRDGEAFRRGNSKATDDFDAVEETESFVD